MRKCHQLRHRKENQKIKRLTRRTFVILQKEERENWILDQVLRSNISHRENIKTSSFQKCVPSNAQLSIC
ncbi:hypothetical protein HI914_04410 [Erysiphe necator]|nr:hypothetical protein HI914_04410 [Erysiphe necator]